MPNFTQSKNIRGVPKFNKAKALQTVQTKVQSDAGFNSDWKNCDPRCKFPPKTAAGVDLTQHHNTFGTLLFKLRI